uniref:HMG box mating type protein n=1 Tax=Ophiostoma montium TaxID=230073 RepID=M4PU45_9PEZI|nr:HMG mating type protein [Ophiostoma montium]AGH03266.1 HMG box mating type protein [Ophiostoma montium]
MDLSPITPLTFTIALGGATINTIIDPSVLAEFWTTLSIQVMPGNEVIGIPGPTFRILDEGGKQYIAHNFASSIGEVMVKFVIDGSGTHPDRYLLGRASFFRPENIIASVGDIDVWVPSGYPTQDSMDFPLGDTSSLSASSVRRNSRGGAVKVPRPPNAYILYRKDNHKAVKEENPSLSNNDIFRVHYHKMAVEIKRQVEILHPHYKYNPRKSYEIRRRAKASNHGVYTVENAQASGSSDAMPTPPTDCETASTGSQMSPASDI